MHQINPKKLHLSKWTAVLPINREKHFLVTELIVDEDNKVQECVLEAVLSKRTQTIDWRTLKNPNTWRQGWV